MNAVDNLFTAFLNGWIFIDAIKSGDTILSIATLLNNLFF